MSIFNPTKIFSKRQLSSKDVLSRRLRELAFFEPGVSITLIDERDDWTATYCYEGGIRSYVEFLNQSRTALHPNPIYISGGKQGLEVELALQWTTAYAENIVFFVNNINTIDGGTHVSGFKGALTRSFNTYLSESSLL